MSCARPQMLMSARIEPRPSLARELTAENVPKFQTAKPKPSRMPWANVAADACDHSAAKDSTARIARPITPNARMPRTASDTRERNAASSAFRERSRKPSSRCGSVPVALMTRTPSTLSWIHEVNALLRSRARLKRVRSRGEKTSPR